MIYLDHAAGTKVAPEVLEAMMPYFGEQFGNPSSLHTPGQAARQAIDAARRTCAQLLGAASPREIIFTSGGTESNNLAIFGLAQTCGKRTPGAPPHLITSAIEHESVLEPMRELERRGFQVTYLPVDREGFIKFNALQGALRPETVLISIIAANNEVGTIQPLVGVAKILNDYKKSLQRDPAGPPFFHTDACQAAGVLDLLSSADLLTLNGSKIYGPKGVGLLYVRSKVSLAPLFYGGGQEHKNRAGTENVAGIVGLAKALELAVQNREAENLRLTELRNHLWEDLKKSIPNLMLNGPLADRLPNNLNLIVKGVEGEILLMRLDQAGVCASAGSACTAGSAEPSHVLRAMGVPKQDAYSAVRFSLGRENTTEQINRVVDEMVKIVKELRAQSGR